MGLSVLGLTAVIETGGRDVLSLSYPDLVMPVEQAEKLCGFKIEKTTDFGGWHGKKHPLPDTLEVFDKLGMRLETVDIHPSRGVERVVDLNVPTYLGQFDLVIDPGTTEHCFNAGTAIINAAEAVREGGAIIHLAPVTMINHGFYNFCPTLFVDLYTQNGWTVEVLGLTDGTGLQEIEPWARRQCPPECSILVIARRNGNEPMKLPTQQKYLRNPDLK
jgi:hypothetical protein